MSKNVLIVDDQFGIRLLLREVLRSEGINVNDVSSGEEAIKGWHSFQPDLVLLDMKMPGMNGVELLRHFRKQFKTDIPVFMMTAYSELDMIEEAERLGVDRQFIKPFDIYDVAKAISKEVTKNENLQPV